MRRRRLLAVLVAVVLPAVLASVAESAIHPPLSHEGRWFTDRDGRAVILHGPNMVYKVGSYRPEDSGFGRDDARFLKRQGFNTVRLGIIYKGLEPKPPGANGKARYRTGYIRSIARTERLLSHYGIQTLLDFHQDLYNEKFQGEGWPDWQVRDQDGPNQLQQGFPANYLVNLGLNGAFDSFWSNTQVEGRGLQDAYAQAWQRIAKRFRNRRNVMGYDLLNEPWPGGLGGLPTWASCVNVIGCPAFDTGPLSAFSNKMIAAIREVDRSTLVFYEPLLTFDFGAATSHPDTGDPNAGFSFHDYCLPAGLGFGTLPGSDVGCGTVEELPFDNAETQVEATGDVPFLTEFGATDDLPTIERLVDFADDHMVSWQYWHYCGCGEPTSQVSADVQAVVKDPTEPPKGDNLKREKLKVLARPFPRAVAGTPQSFGFDPDTQRFDLTWSKAGPAGKVRRRLATEVFVPRIQYPGGYEVEATGAKVMSKPGARVLRLRRSRHAETASVALTPAA